LRFPLLFTSASAAAAAAAANHQRTTNHQQTPTTKQPPTINHQRHHRALSFQNHVGQHEERCEVCELMPLDSLVAPQIEVATDHRRGPHIGSNPTNSIYYSYLQTRA
jgi:hypothetical protein